VLIQQDVRLYSVLDYRHHDGRLPFGSAALFVLGSWSWISPTIGFPVVLLFPDGTVSGRRWHRLLRAYVALAALIVAAEIASQTSVHLSRVVRVDTLGEYSGNGMPTGFWNAVAIASWLVALLFPLFWASFVGYQVASWRRSSGERREQLKWLMSGAAICVVGTITVTVTESSSGYVQVVPALATLGIAALPVSLGIGILKYRLYEIDRLISRTISYLTVTGLLVSVFLGLVVLITRVLPFSSPVAVAASTLAAAALFNPLRKRVQHLVDRRFNRAHYDAEATVAAFRMRLREQADLDTVQQELLHVVDRAVAPAHASLWIRQTRMGSRR